MRRTLACCPDCWCAHSQDIVRGHVSSDPRDLVAAEGLALFFTADDGIAGRELWRSDGALGFLDAQPDEGFPATGGAGTYRVKDVFPGVQSSDPLHLVWEPSLGLLFFAAHEGVHGVELWASDGSTSGTAMVKDICVGTRDSMPSHLTSWQGRLYFQADDCSTGPELWSSDGTDAGTKLVFDGRPGASGSFPSYMVPFAPATSGGERLFFMANAGGYDGGVSASLPQAWGGARLWSSDGTDSGTRRVLEQRTMADFTLDRKSLEASRPAHMATFGGALYVPATRDRIVALEKMMSAHEVSEEGFAQVIATQHPVARCHS